MPLFLTMDIQKNRELLLNTDRFREDRLQTIMPVKHLPMKQGITLTYFIFGVMMAVHVPVLTLLTIHQTRLMLQLVASVEYILIAALLPAMVFYTRIIWTIVLTNAWYCLQHNRQTGCKQPC